MSLIYGITKDGKKIHIDDYVKGMEIYSPLGGELVAKRGEIKEHHYAHKNACNKDNWLDPVMTEWHKSYQSICDRKNVEYRISKNGKLHIADIYNNGMVIELQHSPISNETIDERETFYMNMIWLFDNTEREGPGMIKIRKSQIILRAGRLVKMLYKGHIRETTKPTYLDLGDRILKLLCNSSDKRSIWCLEMTHKEFLEKYMNGIQISEYDVKKDPVHLDESQSIKDLEIEYSEEIIEILYNETNKDYMYNIIKKYFGNEMENEDMPLYVTYYLKCDDESGSSSQEAKRMKQSLCDYMIDMELEYNCNAVIFEAKGDVLVRSEDLPYSKYKYTYYNTDRGYYELKGISDDKNKKYHKTDCRNYWLKLRSHMELLRIIKLKNPVCIIDAYFFIDNAVVIPFKMVQDSESSEIYIDDKKTYHYKEFLKNYFRWTNKKWSASVKSQDEILTNENSTAFEKEKQFNENQIKLLDNLNNEELAALRVYIDFMWKYNSSLWKTYINLTEENRLNNYLKDKNLTIGKDISDVYYDQLKKKLIVGRLNKEQNEKLIMGTLKWKIERLQYLGVLSS